MVTINTQMLIEYFYKLQNGQVAYANDGDFGDNGLTEAWNSMVAQIIRDKNDVAAEVNNILKEVTQMDRVRDIVIGMENQDQTISMIANNSKQMAESISSSAQLATTVSENSGTASNLSREGYQTITKAFSFVDSSFNSIDGVNKQMVQVLEQTKQIDEIVNIIKTIAKQTNLLALNAAIESARAGEHGRGFSVVANEVNKLADNTRESVMKIEKFIDELQEHVQISVNNMQNTSDQLQAGKELVDGALESINKINTSVNKIADEIVQIAASNEEQAATSEEISSETDELSKTTADLSQKTNHTALTIFNVSTKLNKLRTVTTQNTEGFSKNELLDMYIVDHLMWRWRIYNMLLGFEKIDTHNVGNHKSCRLGNWYYNIVDSKIKADFSFSQIERPHVEFHRAVHDTVQAYNNKDLMKAGQHFQELDEYSNEVVQLLQRLKN